HLMAEVARELDRPEPGVAATHVQDHPVALVLAAVVDEQDLRGAVELLHQRLEARHELGQAVFLVVDRDDQGVFGRSHVRTHVSGRAPGRPGRSFGENRPRIIRASWGPVSRSDGTAATHRASVCEAPRVAPSPPRDPADLIARFTDVCAADDRIVAAFLAGSHARGEADAYSDIDLCVIAADNAYGGVAPPRGDLVRALGEPLFLEDFGRDDNVFFVLADGTEGE